MDFCQCVIPVRTLNDDPRVYETENESLLNEQKCNIDTYEDGVFCTPKNKSRAKEPRVKFERLNPNCNYNATESFV